MNDFMIILRGAPLSAHTWAVKPMQICLFAIENTPPVFIVRFIIAQKFNFVDTQQNILQWCDKLEFDVPCSIEYVGALSERPCGKMLRIRRKSGEKVPPCCRAIDDRPYIHAIRWYFKFQFVVLSKKQRVRCRTLCFYCFISQPDRRRSAACSVPSGRSRERCPSWSSWSPG